MPKGLRRREFLGWTVAGVGFPALLGVTESNATVSLPAVTLHANKKSMWDYLARPVKVINPGIQETWNNGSHFAFDGYGGSLRSNSIAHGWFQEGSPSELKPFFCTVDYGDPVAITKFVHYFYAPSVKDYRADPLSTSSAFSALNIYRSDDGINWSLVESVKEMAPDCPQVITLSHPAQARYYKLEVTGLIPGARGY